MDLSVGSGNTESIQQMVESVETVEVVSGTERTSTGQENGSKIEASSQLSVPSSGMIEIDPQTLTYTLVEMANQQLAQGNTMLSSSLTPSSLTTSVMSASDASPLVAAGMKRSAATLNESLAGEFSPDEVPRKKSRNYLDSHKNIEKKRRDRINTGLALLKDLVPDCRQYGSKKLDKAEIIEFTIQYIKRLQAQAQKRTAGDIDISGSQREWCNEIMTWIFQNKLLYSGPNALEQFCNALLLNLQSYGNPTTTSLGSPTSNLLLNQAQAAGQSSSSSDDESFKASLAQQLVSCFNNQGGGGATDSTSGKLENTPNQQQIAQIQALLLLQQQQLLGQQQNPEGGGATNGTQQDDNQTQQLQQLQQLQTFLLQHFASESGHQKQPSNEDNAVYTEDSETGSNTLANNGPSLLVGSNMSANATTISSSINLPSTIVSGEGNRTDIAQSPIYTSTAALEDTLLDSAENGQTSTQMWSGQEQDSSILLESSVPHDTIEGTVVEEEVDVELLSNAQQKMADS